MNFHKVTEDWLIKIEQKLHLVAKRNERITKRTENILAVLDDELLKIKQEENMGKSKKKVLSWWERFKQFLANLFNK